MTQRRGTAIRKAAQAAAVATFPEFSDKAALNWFKWEKLNGRNVLEDGEFSSFIVAYRKATTTTQEG